MNYFYKLFNQSIDDLSIEIVNYDIYLNMDGNSKK